MTASTDRAGYIAGLRKIADALEANPDLPLPYDGHRLGMSVFTHSREECAAWARVLDGQKRKEVDDENPSFGFEVHGVIAGLRMAVHAPRDEVCTRRVLGTREVTREVPDPKALASVPTVTVTETVEDVEWDCGPLLAPATEAMSA